MIRSCACTPAQARARAQACPRAWRAPRARSLPPTPTKAPPRLPSPRANAGGSRNSTAPRIAANAHRRSESINNTGQDALSSPRLMN
eukprot:6192129-Pleurochrysis_carterae.AAC.4